MLGWGCLASVAAAAVVMSVAQAAGARSSTEPTPQLYLFDQTFPNRIWEVDPTRPSVGNPLITELRAAVPEIELMHGDFYASTNTSQILYRIQGSTGALLESIPLTFVLGGNVITAMEHIDGVLYGATTEAGGGVQPRLVRINTITGVVGHVGVLQNVQHPIAGIAHRNGVTYGVTSRQGGPARLYEITLNNGITKDLGLITEQFTGAGITLTGLEFGPDGVLYGLGRGPTNNDFLYAIDPVTQRATTIGRMPGLFNATSLTAGSIPGPGAVVLLGLGLGMAHRRGRPRRLA